MKASTVIFFDLVLGGAAVAVFGHRLVKNYHRKVETPDAYMIQNQESGYVIRPKDAAIADGVAIIQYPPKNWECTTWQMIGIGEDTYLLKDLYTQKSFAPESKPVEGTKLAQAPIGGDAMQHWVFEASADSSYTIRLENTSLYITSHDDQLDSPLTLETRVDGAKNQQWTLKQQHPLV